MLTTIQPPYVHTLTSVQRLRSTHLFVSSGLVVNFCLGDSLIPHFSFFPFPVPFLPIPLTPSLPYSHPPLLPPFLAPPRKAGGGADMELGHIL